MIRNLFKKITAGALALMMLGTAVPAGSDFTGVFGGSEITASAEPNSQYTIVFDAGGGSGTMKSVTVYKNETYLFPKCTFTAPEYSVFSYWTMTGVDGIFYPYGNEEPPNEVKIAENCATDGIITVTAHWKEQKCGDTAWWEFDKDTGKLSINGTGAMYDYDSVARPWFKDIKSVEISAGITHIGKHAFWVSDYLETVTFAKGSKLETIGESAFYYCKSLISINLPEGLTTIGNFAFYDNERLSEVDIPASVTSIGEFAFSD